MKSRVGLGTFPLASVFNAISEKDAEALVKQFIDEGGYYIDTAPLYGYGKVEKLLGKVFKSINRDKFYLITKTVKYIVDKGNVFESGKYEDVIKQIDNSLSRLNLDYIDLLMVHSPDPSTPIKETLNALEELQRKGKVKELAVSNVNLEELKAYNKTNKIKYVQNRFSLINRSLSDLFKQYLLNNNIYLIPYHLLEIGLLTDLSLIDIKLREGDLRKQLPYWNADNQQVISQWVNNYLRPITDALEISISQLNIAWALHQPYIDFVIVGTTKIENLKSSLQANSIKLDKSILDSLDKAYLNLEDEIRNKFHKSIKDFRGLNEKYY